LLNVTDKVKHLPVLQCHTKSAILPSGQRGFWVLLMALGNVFFYSSIFAIKVIDFVLNNHGHNMAMR
jgi:hypothetical protein